MATFITIGYGDRAGYERTGPSVRDAAHAHDTHLREGGALMGVAGAPVQVRNHDGESIRTTRGQFLRSDLPIAGFAVFEATDIEEAIRLVSETPCAVANGVVEVWPLESVAVEPTSDQTLSPIQLVTTNASTQTTWRREAMYDDEGR